jgi:hypothetical protein
MGGWKLLSSKDLQALFGITSDSSIISLGMGFFLPTKEQGIFLATIAK